MVGYRGGESNPPSPSPRKRKTEAEINRLPWDGCRFAVYFFRALAVTLWPSLIPHRGSIIEQIGLRYQAITDFCGLGNLKMQATTLNVDETWVMISSGIAQRRRVWTV